jgi:hypothetical protein
MRYRAQVRRLSVVLPLLVFACADGAADSGSLSQASVPTTLSAGESSATSAGSSGGSGGELASTSHAVTGEPDSAGSGSTVVDDPAASTGGDPGGSTGAPLPSKSCEYKSTTYAAAPQELMVAKGSAKQLLFTVPGLPDPGLVSAATLRFVSYDSDHPGEEGVIVVNGGAPIDLPAELGWTNIDHETAVVITDRTVAGDNTIAFGAGAAEVGTFYRISKVALELEAAVADCPAPPDMPMGPAKAVQLDFNAATYGQRHNWVLRCDFGEGYAFTAKGDQAALDCGKLYNPDGTRKGTATFVFEDLVPATYEITIASRHSANRNPKGALFVVDGEAKRVDQTQGDAITVDTWGTKQLAGTIEVVLDSAMEGESDSVTWVRLEPQ